MLVSGEKAPGGRARLSLSPGGEEPLPEREGLSDRAPPLAGPSAGPRCDVKNEVRGPRDPGPSACLIPTAAGLTPS